MNLLAQSMQDIFGKVAPPPGSEAIAGDPIEGLGKLISLAIKLFITGAGLMLAAYLLWGAYDWITSGGEKEKVSKAQNKITFALVGMVLVFIVITGYGLIAGDILGIIVNTPDGWQLKISTFK